MSNYNYNSGGSVWNMDEKRMYELNLYMISFLRNFNANDYSYAYEDLESIDLILSGSIFKALTEDIAKTWKGAEKTKRKLYQCEDENEAYRLEVEFREYLKQLYRLYNQSCIKQNMYFRKGDDPNFAALKR